MPRVDRTNKSRASQANTAKQQAYSATSGQTAHTLTACARCRQRQASKDLVATGAPKSITNPNLLVTLLCSTRADRRKRKTRCDPTLPRCTPCDRSNSLCEYLDPAKNKLIPRNYVVHLQHKVRSLENELERLEKDDDHEDPEAMVRGGAAVRIQDLAESESKYLGPSSGTQITRLVMQLAKQFTDSKTIRDIVPDAKARQVRELYAAERDKPTSKIYPLISDVAAEDLPNKGLTNKLVRLFNLKVQPMYPILHEPTFTHDLEAVYAGRGTPYQNFIVRMVIAISLQKIDTLYAGLADSYYLAALKYLEPVVRPKDIKTLQCFVLIGEYSLLTPTRTAIYYVIGLAVRLTQALGIHEEKTITRGKDGARADFLEVDMRRRLFWCTLVMELGLSHALGRPSILATSQDHIDVGFFDTADDQYITTGGVLHGAQRPALKKWIAIHFVNMRLLQLEIRRKLYQKKRPSPNNDQDPWFHQMNAKLETWRDASPNADEDVGLDKKWFIGRYNTMIVFLFRPSPQVPRPSVTAALKCFDACHYNIYMQREQIRKRIVDVTWIFTQAIFMAINTMLWSLSYCEVRRRHSKSDVDLHLSVAMEAINLASERWPGVASAVHLYRNLIQAILKIYEKDGDVAIAAGTPSDTASPAASFPDTTTLSRTMSPATAASSAVVTPAERAPPFGYFHQASRRSVEQPPPLPYGVQPSPPPVTTSPMQRDPPAPAPATVSSTMGAVAPSYPDTHQGIPYDGTSPFNQLPSSFPELGSWSPAFVTPRLSNPLNEYTGIPHALPLTHDPTIPTTSAYSWSTMQPAAVYDPNADYLNLIPSFWNQDQDQSMFGTGLNLAQQHELMQELETQGMGDIEMMIAVDNALFYPQLRPY
ncbi:hypothetical protein LTR66_010774 [Elasticomyces elasticus]|nr:hypothetical protein LTR66_010774 [Elasticomyces elasticus]